MRVLVLGGTAEARALAVALESAGVDFVSSLAGRVAHPRMPVGSVRVGGFGGVDGLVRTIRSDGFTHLIDATHPFASTMTAHAVQACARTGLPMTRLARPGWADRPDSDTRTWVPDLDAARDVLVRVVEPLAEPAPPRWTVVLDRGPYSVGGERDLMRRHRVDVLVTKDSGGGYTSAKLDAAAELDVPVVVVSRPAPPTGLVTTADVAGCVTWLGVRAGG